MVFKTILELKNQILDDAIKKGLKNDSKGLRDNSITAKSYAECICCYLSLLIGQLANYSSTICGWQVKNASMISFLMSRHNYDLGFCRM